ncbi:MAG: PAS domain S-box protein [Nitrospirae bacterium]|nr:PAS domain S-box protein [Nitrospirota bacterium]
MRRADGNTADQTNERLRKELTALQARLTQLERLESEHGQAEAKFRGLLEAAPDAIAIVDGTGRIVLVNAQTEALFGYGRDELIGRPVELLVPERFRNAHIGHRSAYASAPRTRPMGQCLDLLGRRKDGTEVPIEVSLSPMTMGDEVLTISTLRDITERKRTEEELRVQKRALEDKVREMDDFMHVVSHDLKEPLRGIEAFAGFLLEDYGPSLDGDGKRYVNFLKQAAVRMRDLIHDLLTLASISRKGPTTQTVDLNRILAQAQRDLEYTIQQKHAEIRVVSTLPTVVCDPTQIGEVFNNLISNAVKFNTRPHPVIEIASRKEGDAHVISVADNGIGIDPRYMERIFGLFERLHPQEEFEGTGAGLAICKKVVEGGGGRIWVTSQPGEGSTFSFTIPKRREESSTAEQLPAGGGNVEGRNAS